MMKIENMKKIPIVICGVLCLFTNIKDCYASPLSFPARLTSGGGGGGSAEIPYTTDDFKVGGVTYQYKYKQEINTNTTVHINAYDKNGESLIPEETTIETGKTFKAGTWIGVNVMEIHTVAWSVYDFQFDKLMTKYTCKYRVPASTYSCPKEKTLTEKQCANKGGTVIGDGPSGRVICKIPKICSKGGYDITANGKELNYEEPYTCPSKYNGYELKEQKKETVIYHNAVPDSIKKEKKQEIITKVHDDANGEINSPATSMKYITNNKYPKDNNLYTVLVDDQIGKGYIDSYKSGDESGTIEKRYEILEKDVCMNLKTAEVSYGRSCDSSKGEIKIEMGQTYDTFLKQTVDYWHYFIPLNTKSNQDFYLDVIKNENSKFKAERCLAFMESKKNYQELITPINAKGESKVFIGDYHKYTDKSLSVDQKTVKEMGYCGVSARIHFPISQEFYNEESDAKNNVKLKGFNFYYRPIDINDPFPNGIGSKSLWFEWSKSSPKNPEISKSYDEVTYIATNINANKIRNYNKDYSYASWSNMNIDGTSNFIKNEGIIARKDSKYNGYKLGCGPANKNKILPDGKTNHLYIKGCDTK